MSRDTSPKCRQCRREGEKLYLKGTKCYTSKCAIETKPNKAPGMHGLRKAKRGDYYIQLREKQKLRRIYGLGEKQFRNFYKEADRLNGPTGENLLKLMEKRLDNVVYRAGFGVSRTEARQIVLHKLITVNGKLVNIPSFSVKEGDEIAVYEKAKGHLRVKSSLNFAKEKGFSEWLDVNPDEMKAVFKSIPERKDLPASINEQLIVELYSK